MSDDAAKKLAHPLPLNMDPRRRRLIKGIAAAAGAGLAGGYLPSSSAAGGSEAEDNFDDIQHIVVVMMENRSFDHMLSWVPGADVPEGPRSFPTKSGRRYQSQVLPDTHNGAAGDPPHGYGAGRTCCNGGAMDGFLIARDGDAGEEGGGDDENTFPIGYFSREQLPFFSGCADYFSIGDRYFTGILASTWPNRVYMHAGQTDRVNTSQGPQDHDGLVSELGTIWDLAKEAKVSHKYYFQDLPFTALWGAKYLDITRHFLEFLSDAKAGTLPAISFVEPAFIGSAIGLSSDDHPTADVYNGQVFLNSVYEALRTGPNWANTLLVINYDEWGGFADHVFPPMAPVTDRERYLTEEGNDGQLGIRVPFLLVGPRARRNALDTNGSAVVHEQYDPNAILNFICDRFRMPRLDVLRSATSGSLASALLPRDQADYSVPPPFDVGSYNSVILRQERTGEAPNRQHRRGPTTLEEAYAMGMGEHFDDLRKLQQMALSSGFQLSGLRL